METKRKALGKGLEELFNSESLELEKIETRIMEEATKDEIVEDDVELSAVLKVFEELLEDVDIEM